MTNNWNRNNPLGLTADNALSEVLKLATRPRNKADILRFSSKSISIACVLRTIVDMLRNIDVDKMTYRELATYVANSLGVTTTVAMVLLPDVASTAFRYRLVNDARLACAFLAAIGLERLTLRVVEKGIRLYNFYFV